MKKILSFTIGLSILISTQLIAQQKNTSPNIILIYMDDMGYGDLSCYGAVDIQTPVLDKMAAEGMRFTNFLTTQAVCSASRASLLTGCYANRVGISGALWPKAGVGLSPDETTIAELLKQKNYATAAFGKWHLGDVKGYLPKSHGFDEYYGIPYSNDMWPVWYDGTPAKQGTNKSGYPPLPLIEGDERVSTITTLDQQAQLTASLTDKTISFVEKNKNHPFFVYLAHPMPHVPINASPAFKGKSKQGLYGDVIQEIDANVGRIIQKIEELKLDKKTLIIFTSDNGPWFNFGNHAGNTGGFREGKGTSFEGGHRVPCIMYWKGVIPAGKVMNQLASTIDVLPTIAAMTNTQLPERKIDGVNLLPLLQGDLTQTPRSEFYYYYRKNSLEAVRKDNWKLVFEHPSRSYLNQVPGKNGFPGPSPEDVMMPKALYDLRRDPGERYDVQKEFPEIVKMLETIAEKARQELGDDLQKRTGNEVRLPATIVYQ
ncbi:MAG: sulfatase [Bacteroidota bacterium]|jgi:arylsulfatase A-like enzyme